MALGDHQNTNRKSKGKKTKKLSQKEQSERFKETALTLDVDESGKAFKQAFKKIAPPIPGQKNLGHEDR